VSKQRAHQIAEEKGFPSPLAEDPRGRVWSRVRGAGVGEALAPREALALAEELGLFPLATLDHVEGLQRLRL
jgi:hypothetical protein